MAGKLVTHLGYGIGHVSLTDELLSSEHRYLKLNKELPIGEETLISQVASFSNTSGNSYPSIDGNIYLGQNHKLDIIEEGLGYDCKWDKVSIKIGEETLTGYTHGGLVDKNSIPFKCTKPTLASLAQSKDWTKQEPNKAYYDHVMMKWCVPFESEHESTGGSDEMLSARMNDTRPEAIKLILLEIGKYAPSNILKLDYVVLAEEWYLDPRPNTKLRVLVTIEEKYVSAMTDIDLTYERGDKIISLNTATYEDEIKEASEIMQVYAGEIDLFEGTVENLDLRREAKRLEIIPKRLDRLLLSNTINVKDDTVIEIGLNAAGTCDYVAENSQGVYKNISKNVNSLRDSEPFDSERTMHYLYMLQEILKSRQEETNWTSFVSGFTISPEAGIFPSLPKGSSPLDISGATKDKNSSSAQNSTAASLDRESRDIWESFGMGGGGSLQDGGACSGNNFKLNLWNKKTRDKMIEDLDKRVKDIDMGPAVLGAGEGSLFKTVKDTAEEELKYGKSAVVNKIKEEAEAAIDEIGDKVLGNLKPILENIHSLDGIFKEVLNKICLGDLAIPALACLEVPALSDELKQVLSDLPDLDLCKSGNQICIPTISLPTFQTTDLMREMSRAILNAILDVLTKVFVEMVKAILESLLSICGEEDDEDAIRPTDIPFMPNISGGIDLPNLVSDIADLLSPREFCKLLNGEASQKTLSLIRSLIKNRYPSLSEKLKTKTDIIDLFFGLGAMVDSDMCNQLANLPEGPASLNCSNPYQIDDNLLAKLVADDDLTDEQLEEQLAKARERKKVKYEKFAEIIKIITGESGKSFEEIAMSMIHDSEGSVININNESINYMHENLLRVIFSGIEKSFDTASQALLNAFVETTFQKVKVPYWTKLPDGERFRSMAASKLVSQGVSEGTLVKYALENNGMVLADSEAQKTNKRIRTLLKDIESNDVFNMVPAEDGSGIYYELTIPPDPEIIETIDRLVENETLTSDQKDDFDRLFEASMWKVRYKMPFGKNSYTTTDDGHFHVYSVDINGDGIAEEYYDRTGVEEPHKHVIKNWIVHEAHNHTHKVSKRRVYDKFGIEVIPADNPSSYRAISTTSIEKISDELRQYILDILPDDVDIPISETIVDLSSRSAFEVATDLDLSLGLPRTSTGIMFDISNSSEAVVRINGKFSCLLEDIPQGSNLQSSEIIVWYADRSHKGIENTKSAWKRFGSAPHVVPSLPTDVGYPTDFTIHNEGQVPFFDIPPATEDVPTTYSIYITTNNEEAGIGIRGFRTSLPLDEPRRSVATSQDERLTLFSGVSQGTPEDSTNLFIGEDIGPINSSVGTNSEAFFIGSVGYSMVVEDPSVFDSPEECELELGTTDMQFLPPQHDIFGSYVVKQWEDVIEDMDVEPASTEAKDDNFQTFKKDLYKYFSTVVYSQASKDLLAMIGQQIASSQLLNDEVNTKRIAGIDMSIISSKMQKLSLNRRPSKAEIACDIDTHLLRVDSHKQEIRKNIRENNCFSKDAFIENPDGSSRTEQTSWETTVLETVIKMTIRSYMIDYAIRGIFPLTRFSLDQSVDNYLVEFFTRKMIADMSQFGFVEYAAPFVETANVVYSDMLMNGRIVPEDTTAGDTNVGIRAITKQILPEVYKDLICIIKKDLILDINISSSPINDKLLNEWLPVLDLPRSGARTRYTNLGDDLEPLADSLKEYLIDYPTKKKAVQKLREAVKAAQAELDKATKAYSDEYKVLSSDIKKMKLREGELLSALIQDGCPDGLNIVNKARAQGDQALQRTTRLTRCFDNYDELLGLIGGPHTFSVDTNMFWSDSHDAGAPNPNYAGRWDVEADPHRDHKYGRRQREFYDGRGSDPQHSGYAKPKTEAKQAFDQHKDALKVAEDDLYSFVIGTTAASEFDIEDIVDVFYDANGNIEAVKQDLSTESFLPTLSSGDAAGVSLNLKNGNFFLEKFWKINRKSSDGIREALDSVALQFPDANMSKIIDNFNFAWNNSFESIDVPDGITDEELISILKSSTGYNGDRYYNVEEFNEKFNIFIKEFAAMQNSSIESMMSARALEKELEELDLQRQIDEWTKWYDYWTDASQRSWPNEIYSADDSTLPHQDYHPLARTPSDLRNNGWGEEWTTGELTFGLSGSDNTYRPWEKTNYWRSTDPAPKVVAGGTFAKGWNPGHTDDIPGYYLCEGSSSNYCMGFGSIPHNTHGVKYATAVLEFKTDQIEFARTKDPAVFTSAITTAERKIEDWKDWYNIVKETVENRNHNVQSDIKRWITEYDATPPDPPIPEDLPPRPYLPRWTSGQIEPFIENVEDYHTHSRTLPTQANFEEERIVITDTKKFRKVTAPLIDFISNKGIDQSPFDIQRFDPRGRGSDNVPWDVDGISDYREKITELEGRKNELIAHLAMLELGTPFALNNFFDELAPGLRVVYTPPVDDSQYVDVDRDTPFADYDVGGGQNRIDEIVDALAPENQDILSYIQNESKDRKRAFYFKEEVRRGKFDVSISEEERDALAELAPESLSSRISYNEYSREVYPIPLIDSTGVELMDAACSESSGVLPSWWTINQNTSVFNLDGYGDWVNELDITIPNIQKRISNSKEFNLLFNFVFPINRYLSMLNVYSVLVSSSLEGMETAMSGPRQKMFKLFEMLTSGGQYQAPPLPRYDANDVAGDGETRCFQLDDESISLEKLLTGDFAINAEMPKNPFDVDWGAITKTANDNIKSLFKALVEFQDPNIKLAKKVRTLLANLGMCPLPPLFLISLGLLPPTVFGYPPIGIGIGPPLTPIGMAYLLFGFEMETLWEYFYTDKAIGEVKLIDCEAVEDRTCGQPPESIE